MSFNEQTMVQKINQILVVLDKEIRSFLQNDGGDCEVIDVKEEDGTKIYLKYTGACSG